MALKSLLPEIQYRVSVHGTFAAGGIPAFHTQNETMLSASGKHTFATNLRDRDEESTGVSYTKHGGTTGDRYTEELRKALKSQLFSQGNCTKLSSTNHNYIGRCHFGVEGEVGQ